MYNHSKCRTVEEIHDLLFGLMEECPDMSTRIKSAQERAARVRVRNSVKFETGQNLLTEDSNTYVQLHIDRLLSM